MGKYYHHLSYDDRLLLKQMLDNEYSLKEIAEKLGVHISTIYREIKRFEKPSQYNPEIAQYVYSKELEAKGRKPKLQLDPNLAKYISQLILQESLSPVEIIDRLRLENYPNFPSSKTTIYAAIDSGLIPSVTRETLLLKRKRTHMFSNGLIKIPKWICEELDLKDNEELYIDIADGKIIINKSKKTFDMFPSTTSKS